MIEIFCIILVGWFFIWGVYATIQEGMIFERYGIFLAKLPIFFQKPLGTCPICMSSVFGSLIYWISYFTGWLDVSHSVLLWIFYTFALSGFSYLILIFAPHEDVLEEEETEN